MYGAVSLGAKDYEVDLEDYSQCWVAPGAQTPVVAEIQVKANRALKKAGYEPIVVTGKFDKETCGAIFVLKEKGFDLDLENCPGGAVWNCKGQLAPKKAAATEEAKFGGGWVLGIGALLALGTFVALR